MSYVAKLFPWLTLHDRIQIVLGYSCNARCGHCGVNAGETSLHMDINTFKNAVKESSDLGVDNFTLTGGEPTLYKEHLAAATDLMDNYSVSMRILSNGWFGYHESWFESSIKPIIEKGGEITVSLNNYLAEFVPVDTTAKAVKKILRCTDECRILCIAGSTSPLLLTEFLKWVGAEEFYLVKERKRGNVYSAILDHGKVSIVYKGGISPMGRGEKISKKSNPPNVFAELPHECSVTCLTISPHGNVLLCPVSNCFSHLVCGNIIEISLPDILDSIPFMAHTPFYYIRNFLKERYSRIKFFNQCDVCYRLDKGNLGVSVNAFSHFFK
jgi:hypothetical protein